MAALMVGGALLSSFLNVLFDKLATKEVVEFFRGKKVIADLVDELKIWLLSANALLNDAEEKQFRDQNVKNWLEELKEMLYKADHVIDKINTEALRCKVEGGESESIRSKILKSLPQLCSAFDNTVKSDIQEILRWIKLLVKQKESLGLKDGVHYKSPQIRSVAPLIVDEQVYGRDAEKENIIEALLSDDHGAHRISVLPIVGMGGIGKTTLAQLVFYDSRIQNHFDLKVWVTVSEEFDVSKITKIIFETTTKRKTDTEDLHQLQNELKKVLEGKKFLFVHDDVWNENYQLWELLKSPFESGAQGSKIIVTTRSKIVASKMGTIRSCDLQTISDDDCWQLFARHVFTNLDSDARSELQQIGIEIVRKCKGLPLAVKSLAGFLRSVSDANEWRKIRDSDVWELQFREDQKNKIPPALWLSYYFLPAQLKRCFAFCSIFPKDYEFCGYDREKLILLWMAEGLLHVEGKRMEDVGEEYLEDLVSRSFFQQSNRYGESILHMHDLVHDLAIRMSGEFYFIPDGCSELHNCSSKICHLSYRGKDGETMKLESLPPTKCLRTFLTLPLSRHWEFHGMLMQEVQAKMLLRAGGCLRVLSLFDSSNMEHLNSIGNLKHLRYLDLSYTSLKELPVSICTLYNLQTLLLLKCTELVQLPTKMCSLVSLRHLVIRDTSLKEMPPQMCKLTNLQTLSDFVLGENSGSRVKELGALRLLRGSLRISGLENVADVEDVLEAGLKKKDGLTELILIWKCGETDDTSKEREVLNALEPHRKLKRLEIQGYRGTIFPDWMAHDSFGDIVEVLLQDCRNCCLFPPFWQLPSLRRLEIDGMNVSSIENGCSSASSTRPFPLLESLSMCRMYALERWPNGANQEGGLFPCLEYFTLGSCDKLNVGLPAGCLPSLKSIVIRNCKEMVGVFPTIQDIDTAYPSLESIYLHACEKVESFSEMGLPSNLKFLEIVQCEKLIANRMGWNLQRLSNLQRLDVGGRKQLGVVDSFPEEGLLPSSLTCLSIWSFEHLKSLNGKGLRHLTFLQTLHIYRCEKLECLPKDGLPSSISCLNIDWCPLLKERCQRETGEDWPKIQHIPEIKIDGKQI